MVITVSRTESSIKNFMTAMVGQFFGIVISFFARIVFLRYLNEEYLGLNGLFTNILTIFSLVELGVGPAMNFSLYKPLAEHDIKRVKSLMALYRKAYILIGCAIAAIGLLFTPFYILLMDEVPDIPRLTLIYWLFTANTVISYFYSYKRALIICDEKRYIANIYRYGFYFALNAAQIVILVLTHDYILFLVLQVLFTFAENVAVSRKADRLYPYLRDKKTEPLPAESIADIHKNIGAMLFHKIGSMVVMSTDNLILSRFVGLAAVGLYSNYYLITNALNTIITQVFNSVTASIGNLNASEAAEDRNKLERTFERLFFMNFWIYGFCSCCLWVLFNPFISLWLGDALLFDTFTVLVIVVNFYLTGMRKVAQPFRDATGAFYYDRYKPLVESVINIVASIWLVRHLGTAGVFLGTIISTLTTCIWVEPYVLYKYVFRKGAVGYAASFLLYTFVSVFACVVTAYAANILHFGSVYVDFAWKVLICAFVPNSVFLLCFFRTAHFLYFFKLISSLLRRLR